MEQLKGEPVTVLPFKEIEKVSDLIEFEGPILSHFKDKFGKDILFYWVDVDDDFHRWLVFQVSEVQLYKYLSKRVSLRDVITNPLNDIFYSVEIGEQLEYKNIVQIFKDDLNEKYIPKENSFLKSDIPAYYSIKLRKHEESFVMESFLEQALFIKVEPKKSVRSRDHGLVNILDGAGFLYAYAVSYKVFISYKIRKEFHKRDIIDNKRVNRAIRQATVRNMPNLVKTQAASFAIAISPNNISEVNEQFLNKEWRENAFSVFKRDVVDIDKKNEKEVDGIVDEYGDKYVTDIYRPIIDLYNNSNVEINITDRNFIPKRTINSIKDDIKRRLILPKKDSAEEQTEKLALVKFNNRTGKITDTSHATLFDQSIQPSWATDEIRSERKTYKLLHKLYADYTRENNVHVIEHELLDIYASGDSMPEAETNFYQEFDNLHEALFSKENKDLSYEEIQKKNYLLFYVRT